MELMSIFVNEETKEGLYAVRYDGEELNEYRRLLTIWKDYEYLETYVGSNADYLNSDFFNGLKLEKIPDKIFAEAKELSKLFASTRKSFLAGELKLQEMFWPLFDAEFVIPIHQKTKASIKEWRYRRALLRLYAIRISENAYVITGGAIKLVRRMKDHPDTKRELDKLVKVKAFLESIELYNEDDLKLFEL